MYLAFQVACCELRLSAKARWCENIGVGDLVVAVVEVARLQPALFHQALEAVVGLAQADAHFLGLLAGIRRLQNRDNLCLCES